MTSRRRALSSMSRPTSKMEAAGQAIDPHERVARRRIRLVGARISGLELPRLVEDAGRQRADIAGDALAERRGDEIERGAGRARAPLDDIDEAPQSAEPILLGKAVDLGLDGGVELVVEEALRVPRHVAEGREREEREHHQIGEGELEGRGADELAERRHSSASPPTRTM